MPAAPSAEPQLVAGDCTVPLSVDVDPSAWPAPVQALAHTPGSGARPTSLAELTTLRVGGPVGSYVEATTQSELTEAIREADAAGTPVLVIGGGSNILASDAGFDGLVIRDARAEVSLVSDSVCGGVEVTATAGTTWDDLVREAIASQWAGFAPLSGIPGTVGAAPVQNIGAYGSEAAELLASIHRKADSSQVPLSVTLSWRLNGTDISVNFSCDDSPDNIRATTQRELTLVGKAKSVTRGEPDDSIHADYGTVDAVPASITEPTGLDFYKTFTLHNWNVTSYPTQDGSYSNPPITDLIAATRQASPTGTIELSNGTLSITGLVTDENKGLTPEAAAPVVHAVNNCQAAGLTTLQLNNWTLNTTSNVADPWLTFTCNNGTWTPNDDGSTGQDEATILNKAAEL